ncbi:MAG: aminoglycoside 6'-N-acetyltransferase [Longimicrobiales bacterium]
MSLGMTAFTLRTARPADVPSLAKLRATLWPEGTVDEHAAELPALLDSPNDCVFVAEADGRIIAFFEGRLRSHADGCETSPVGFMEGWFVAEEWRRGGVGSALVRRFEEWARERGCRELASDTWLDNIASQRAHERLGFGEVDRVVNYRKALAADIALDRGTSS